jgi:hypothetical protein
MKRPVQYAVNHAHDTGIGGAHFRQVILAELFLDGTEALRQEWATGAGDGDSGIVVVAVLGRIDGYQLVERRGQVGIVAALVSFVGCSINIHAPTDTAGVFAIGANAAKSAIRPRLEPLGRPRH